ncbi:CinA family protein [Pinisolibacter sp.]|uniref:CinA family protein n=1 Tax=Pinisolibacter sp. TaxID=2172024 RepID=UPI002FDE0578
MLELAAFVDRATRIVERAKARRVMIATAESCTGGLLSGVVTAVPGSSDVLDRGFVTYSNEAKVEMLGVDAAAIDGHGAVSAEVAGEMARGALVRSRADLAVSVTGIAGPGGGTATKPVGLVHFGLARRPNGVVTVERRFGDLGRDAVRMASLDQALALVEEALGLT